MDAGWGSYLKNLRAARANPVFSIRMKSVSVSRKQGYE
jgi:hypothetical protein